MSDLVPEEAVNAGWHEFRYPRPSNDPVSDAFRRGLGAAAPLILAAELERLADQIEDRGHERDLSTGQSGATPCDGECDNDGCHQLSAVGTFYRVSGSLRRRAADLRST